MPERNFPCGETVSDGVQDVFNDILTIALPVTTMEQEITANTLRLVNDEPSTVLSSLYIQSTFKINASYNISHRRASTKTVGKAAGTMVYKSKALRRFGLIHDLDHMDPISSQETIMDTARQQITGKYYANLDPSYFLR